MFSPVYVLHPLRHLWLQVEVRKGGMNADPNLIVLAKPSLLKVRDIPFNHSFLHWIFLRALGCTIPGSSVCGTGNGRCTVWNTLMENGQRLYKQQQTQHDEKEVAHGISHAEQGGYHNSISDETSGRSGRSQWTQQVLPFGRNNGKSEDDASSGERRITHTCSNCAQQVANHTAQCSFCLKHTCLGCATSCASCSNLLCTPCKCLEHFPGGIAEVCPPCVEMLHHRPNQFSQEHEDTCMG
eukprot:gb/GECG01012809.1/.p1 GENE.gb/GECG01012809.1/~~gb/GECG01012809.1/.p1  ORF type:complete len:240 (+),score=20.99 gb/GECG01012809.1/:1-720(+)